MRSIRVKVTVITVVAILISILAVFLASFFTIQEENERSSRGFMNLLAQNTQASVEEYLQSIEQSVEIVANVAYDTLDSVTLATAPRSGRRSSQPRRTPIWPSTAPDCSRPARASPATRTASAPITSALRRRSARRSTASSTRGSARPASPSGSRWTRGSWTPTTSRTPPGSTPRSGGAAHPGSGPTPPITSMRRSPTPTSSRSTRPGR